LDEALDINVLYEPIENLRGFFTNFRRIKVITLNDSLEEDEEYSALFHEIGHACMHGKEVRDMPGAAAFLQQHAAEHEYEIEANYFFAEYIISDDDLLEAWSNGEYFNFFNFAKSFGVPPDILALKYKLMEHKGYDDVPKVPKVPIIPSGDCMGREHLFYY
jgi:Zn-dependent peptidase ImmA (M78 family)